jgi:putative FmdB family regulatory protein
MPIYEYLCTDGHRVDVVQKFADEALTSCEVCGKPAQRVLHAPSIHFKGKGFYATDYGKGGKGSNGDKASDPGSSSDSGSKESAAASSGDGNSGSKSESKGSDSKSSESKSADSKSSGGSSSPKKSDSKAAS